MKRCFRMLVGMFLAVVAVLLVACSSGPPKPDPGTLMVQMNASNNAVILRQIDLQLEREKTRQLEYQAEAAIATGLQAIGESAGDAHSKVVATVALLGASKGRGSGNSAPQTTPQLPPAQQIPQERDTLDRVLQVAQVLVPGGAPALLSPILAANTAAKQIAGQVEQARINGEVSKTQWNTVGLMNHDAVAGMRDLGLGGFTSINDIVTTLGRPNTYSWVVGGDYAGGNLTGRYSGTGSGNTGNLNLGNGFQNFGPDARITSPGPYQTNCTTGNANNTGTTGATGAPSGGVNCPIQ